MLKMNPSPLAALLLSASIGVLASGCSLTPPPRTPYAGADTVGEINSDMLLGSWNVRVLNPLEGEENNQSDMRFNSDGTMVMNSSINNEGMPFAMRMTGRWSVAADLVTMAVESVEETSGSPMAGFLAPMLDSYKDRMVGSANVYEASANRIVLVTGEGDMAQELTRK